VAAARDAFLAACASAYPGLPDLYQQARRRLRDDRVFLALPAELHYPDNKVLLTPSLFEVVLGRLLYDPTNYPNLPRMIAAVSDGDVTAFTQYLGALLLGARDTLNSAAFTAVECRERPHWHRPMAEDTDVLDETLLVGVCADWSGLGPLPLVPGRTSVPTLVLAGQFDPNIPPTLSHEVAESMGENTRWIEFAGMGHSVRHYSPCAQHLHREAESGVGHGLCRDCWRICNLYAADAIDDSQTTPSGHRLIPFITVRRQR
jgi:pimeloyl-ACP methyl ester carboxylesterase